MELFELMTQPATGLPPDFPDKSLIDAVHLRAAFCAVWCNRVVLRDAAVCVRGERGLGHR